MKEWFEYEYGYINIDHQFLYFTSSGNWSEISKLKEFSSKRRIKNFKGNSVIIILTIIGFILFFGLLKMLNSGNISIFYLFGAPILLFFLYKYMKSGIGANYKINLSNIFDIQFENKNCIIHFYDESGDIHQTQLINASEKGHSILKKLKSTI